MLILSVLLELAAEAGAASPQRKEWLAMAVLLGEEEEHGLIPLFRHNR